MTASPCVIWPPSGSVYASIAMALAPKKKNNIPNIMLKKSDLIISDTYVCLLMTTEHSI